MLISQFTLQAKRPLPAQAVPFYHSATKKYTYVKIGTDSQAFAGEWDEADLFYNGLAKVKKGEKYGFINLKGTTVVPYIYANCDNFASGFAVVRSNNKAGLINRAGVILVDTLYDEIGELHEGLISVMKGEKLGFIDTTGKLVIPVNLEYFGFSDEAHPFFSEGLCAVFHMDDLVPENSGFGFIDKTGKLVIPFKYENWGGAGILRYPYFSEGLCVVTKNQKFGYINTKDELVIPMKYDGAEFFSEGCAAVRVKDSVMYIDRIGNQRVRIILGSHDEGAMGFNYKGFKKGAAVVNLSRKFEKTDYGYTFTEEPAVINDQGDIFFKEEGVNYISGFSDNFISYSTETQSFLVIRRKNEKIEIKGDMTSAYICEDERFVLIGFQYFIDDLGKVYKD